jgi:hypothetical protein
MNFRQIRCTITTNAQLNVRPIVFSKITGISVALTRHTQRCLQRARLHENPFLRICCTAVTLCYIPSIGENHQETATVLGMKSVATARLKPEVTSAL